MKISRLLFTGNIIGRSVYRLNHKDNIVLDIKIEILNISKLANFCVSHIKSKLGRFYELNK